MLGGRRNDTALLGEAVTVFRDALNILTSDRDRHRRLLIQHNLATTLEELGEREFSTERLEDAIAYFGKHSANAPTTRNIQLIEYNSTMDLVKYFRHSVDMILELIS